MEDLNKRALESVEAMFAREGVAVSELAGLRVEVKKDEYLELEVAFSIGEKEIVESFVGLGRSDEEALNNALVYFQQVMFFVLLESFFGRESQWVTKEQWGEFAVNIGRPVVRGEGDVLEQISLEFFTALEKELREREWEQEVNWLSVFYAKKNACRLNNRDWAEGKKILDQSAHPRSEDYYSLRLFMTLVNGRGGRT